MYTRNNVTLRATVCCLLTSQTNLHKTILMRTNHAVTGLDGVGTRLYDSPARAELYGYATNNVAYCRPSSSAAFRAQLTGERDRPLCSNETSDIRQNWTLCDHRTSPLHITFELLSLEPRGYLHMHAYGKSNTHRRRRSRLWGACLGLHIMTSYFGSHLFAFHVPDIGNVQCSMIIN